MESRKITLTKGGDDLTWSSWKQDPFAGEVYTIRIDKEKIDGFYTGIAVWNRRGLWSDYVTFKAPTLKGCKEKAVSSLKKLAWRPGRKRYKFSF
jgi:hypothetical protein